MVTKKHAEKCDDCGHTKTQHTGGEGCWGPGADPWDQCGCMAMTLRPSLSVAPPEEVDRYRVLDKDGDAAKEEGMRQAEEAAALPWKERFTRCVHGFTIAGRTFTSEDVIAVVGLPFSDVEKDANNAVGAMMNGLARSGVIEKTGRRLLSQRATSHSAELTEWQKAGTNAVSNY